MRNYVWIGLAGAAGAILRTLAGTSAVGPGGELLLMPLDTLFINGAGAFALGVFLTVAVDRLRLSATVRLAVATGFLGAFTTFSTLCMEAVSLAMDGAAGVAAAYLLLSVLIGVAAAALGIGLGRRLPRVDGVRAEREPNRSSIGGALDRSSVEGAPDRSSDSAPGTAPGDEGGRPR